MRRVTRSAMWRSGEQNTNSQVKLAWGLADKLVYSKIREGTGGKLRLVFSGGAPLAKELAEFFWAIGVPIYQGYGLTETSPVLTSNYPNNRMGSSGIPIPNVELRIAEDGEILAKGPCIMQGYYKSAEATREVLSTDGWFSTGDIGYLDKDNYLFITDRKKDLIKTAAGKFVAPQPIENALKTSRLILNAVVVGDKRKFISALIVPNPTTVAAKAAEQDIKFSSGFAGGLFHQDTRHLSGLEFLIDGQRPLRRTASARGSAMTTCCFSSRCLMPMSFMSSISMSRISSPIRVRPGGRITGTG